MKKPKKILLITLAGIGHLLLSVLTVLLIIFLVIVDGAPYIIVSRSLGEYKEEAFYVEGFRDYIVYGKYSYENVNLEDNMFFSDMTEEDIEIFERCLTNFEKRLSYEEGTELYENYDFDTSIIDMSDYCYISMNTVERKSATTIFIF